MSSRPAVNKRVLSGMRSTGHTHLGHLHGALNNWIKLQTQYDCFFFMADWHALTTHYNDTSNIKSFVWEQLVDWLACGLDPKEATVFIQSDVPEHAELHLLLSMITPLGWLERVPTYKDQQEKLSQLDLTTYGFLGYPLLQAADILIYKADYVPVGEDQVPHVELVREVARRFNHIYGRESDLESKITVALDKIAKKQKKDYLNFKKNYQEKGDKESLKLAIDLVNNQSNLNIADKERLLGYIEGLAKTILLEPEALLTKFAKMPGLDGQKMSKSYGNTIKLRDPLEDIEKKIRTMPTDPARVKKTDPGNPAKCPVWEFHKVYSNKDTQDWVQDGCMHAKIGCIDCKKPVIVAVQSELEPIQDNINNLSKDFDYIKNIAEEGAKKAKEVARFTLDEVKTAIGIKY